MEKKYMYDQKRISTRNQGIGIRGKGQVKTEDKSTMRSRKMASSSGRAVEDKYKARTV